MHWNLEARKRRQKAVTEKIIETKRHKPPITLPSIAICEDEEKNEPKKSQLRKRSKYE